MRRPAQPRRRGDGVPRRQPAPTDARARPLGRRSVGELQAIPLRVGGETMPTLPQFFARIASRTPLVCELKSKFDGDMGSPSASPDRRQYAGPLALKSFDPAPIAHLRARHDGLAPLGIVAEANYRGWYWRALSADQKRSCAAFSHYPETRPDFLSWSVDDTAPFDALPFADLGRTSGDGLDGPNADPAPQRGALGGSDRLRGQAGRLRAPSLHCRGRQIA